MTQTTRPSIPGYTLGTPEVATSPITDAEFALLKQTVLLGDDDVRYLRMAGEVLSDQIEAILDVWYGFVGSNAHLVHYFSGADGKPDARYLGAVRQRFAQWIRDTCAANYDRAWLDYQHEIGLRHTSAKKNRTDGLVSPAPHIHLRYLIAFIVPITATIKPFLSKKGHSAADVDGMYTAWFKAVTLQITLWSEPYVAPSAF
ncbi:protoglobin domain-containing protein [Polyangium jinanense]|uniref:Protogloblin ApPgb n=1 Tax=Polyangium jinanense TaxID=2829994 RepID=A0A9X3X9M6_9BACT|nr:protoglobin domain-containing protein [Polyangium jinanense]MDC3962787.1 protogloblin ApPgb [Polyangium jinanense]MDC3983896.1 protogloblin ApPgb [Polyangium jinanense]